MTETPEENGARLAAEFEDRLAKTPVPYIIAVFDGKRRRFEIERELLGAFEQHHDDSAYAVLRRLVSGEWRVKDVEVVLKFGLKIRLKEDERQWTYLAKDMYRKTGMSMQLPASLLEMAGVEVPVRDAITKHGAATYAELAMLILTAALMGLKPAEAVFDDGTLDEEKGEDADG